MAKIEVCVNMPNDCEIETFDLPAEWDTASPEEREEIEKEIAEAFFFETANYGYVVKE